MPFSSFPSYQLQVLRSLSWRCFFFSFCSKKNLIFLVSQLTANGFSSFHFKHFVQPCLAMAVQWEPVDALFSCHLNYSSNSSSCICTFELFQLLLFSNDLHEDQNSIELSLVRMRTRARISCANNLQLFIFFFKFLM